MLLYSKEKLEKTIAITAQDQNSKFIIPDDALTGNWLAVLKNPDGATEVNAMFSVTGNLYPDTSIRFDKSGYVLGGDLQIFYDDLPPGTTVLLKGSLDAVDVFSKTWENRAGAGIIPYTLPDSETYEVIQVYASKNGVILDSDLSIMSLGSDYILEGTVLNSVTNSPIFPGEICLNGVVKLLDEKGHYQISGPAGSHSVTVVSEGFHPASFDVTLSAPLTSRNFYLIPVTEETGGSIYGATANYDTGEPVGLALVEITNGVDSYQTISNSKSGRFSFSQIPDNSTWTIKASKSGYFSSSDSVNVSGATMHLCRLVSDGSGATPGDGSGVTPGDGSGSSSGSSTGSDRPGRVAAKNSMAEFEKIVPGLLGFIVFAIFLKTFEGL
ncbi:MAG: hypothetical protein PHV51_09590 [Methanosarcinaceae archaeon]|nr:hypothetical protein [Methanosarcinaceae archaeon]